VAWVKTIVSDGHLTIEVSDDGVGGAGTHADGALAALNDRIAALGGTLEVTSPPSRGTRLEARLPLSGTHGALIVLTPFPPARELDRVAEDRCNRALVGDVVPADGKHAGPANQARRAISSTPLPVRARGRREGDRAGLLVDRPGHDLVDVDQDRVNRFICGCARYVSDVEQRSALRQSDIEQLPSLGQLLRVEASTISRALAASSASGVRSGLPVIVVDASCGYELTDLKMLSSGSAAARISGTPIPPGNGRSA
jgi:hypothetical protein